jgi:TonB family protein
MSTSAAILTKSELFDLHIRKFRSICDMHGVQCGSHEDLRGFTHKLTEDRAFAMDFWAFTGKLSSRDGGGLSDERMLAVIVEGITGDSIQDTDGELKGFIDELAALLAGVDVHSTLTRDAEQTPLSPNEQDLQSSAREETERTVSETPLLVLPSRATLISEAVDREVGLASPLPPTLSSSPRVVFISEPVNREADPALPLPSRRSPSTRAAFTSEAVDREAGPASALPVRRSSSSRAVFTPEAVDREVSRTPILPVRRSSSSRAVFISEPIDREADSGSSSSSMLPPSLSAASVSEAADREAGPASSVPSQVVEALRWLQLSSLELKQHLNEIDQKMSRFDPNLEEPASKANSSKAKMRAPVEPAAPPARALAAKSTLVIQDDLWPGPELLASAFGDRWSGSSTPVPLENYAQPRGPHGKALFVVLLLVVAGSTFLLQEYGASLDASYGPGIQRIEGALARGLGQSPPNGSAGARREPDAEPETVSLAPAGPDAISSSADARPAGEPSSTPSAAVAGLGRSLEQAATTASGGSQAGGTNSNSDTRAMSSRSASAPTESTSPNYVPSGDAAGPVDVAPAVMQANLVRSREPAYPRAARVEHVGGPVVVKAIISKSGAVEDVRVIEGNPLLRGAASEAIYKWRFKPYLLNGQPVKVATTLTVDFKPHR